MATESPDASQPSPVNLIALQPADFHSLQTLQYRAAFYGAIMGSLTAALVVAVGEAVGIAARAWLAHRQQKGT
jgi:hypothetical protein